jgi:hypothetical protein
MVSIPTTFGRTRAQTSLELVFRQRSAFNPLAASLADVARLLDEGRLTSVDLVNAYTGQIQKHNKNGARLNAVISLVPEHTALENARKLDRERAMGKTRSRLHGIPFLVKVLSLFHHHSIWSRPNNRAVNRTTCGRTNLSVSQSLAGPSPSRTRLQSRMPILFKRFEGVSVLHLTLLTSSSFSTPA